MTNYGVIYDAFLVKMLEDEWVNWTEEEVKADLKGLLDGAIPWFKFPRKSLERNEEGFLEDLTNNEIQILA
jgi:hypothetical protein